MNEQKEHLKKVYTAFYAQTDTVKDFCEQNSQEHDTSTICRKFH